MRDAGPILHPRPTLVAGVAIDLERADYRFLACGLCGFCFKHPQIPEDKLLACYAKARRDHWGEEVDPRYRRFDLLERLARRHAPGPRILDIGCFNGAMLSHFGPSWERFGVEPSAGAAALATARGISVLGDRLESLPVAETFDVMISVDVAEHINEPLPFFQAAASRLRPGGSLILLTGDTDAWTWRLQGSRYWYCSMVEHVSFYNRSSMKELARRSGLRSVDHFCISHQRTGLGKTSLELVKNAAYVAGNRTGGLGLRPLRRLFVDRCGPNWIGMADHMIHVMQRT